MKTEEILKTKKESGLEEFAALRRQQEAKSERAARTASLSRRAADAPEDTSRVLVRVTAVERQGHDGFHRAGQFWPSAPGGRLAVVTKRMLAALKSEPMLRVDVSPDDVDPASLGDQQPIDVPVRESVDLSQVALAPAPGGGDAVRAAFEAGRLAAENERLRAELEAAKRSTGSAQPEPQAPVVGGDDDGKKGGKASK